MFDSHSLAVGEYYDYVNDFLRTMFADNMHYGYWADPSSGLSLTEAGERMTEELFKRLDVSGDHKILDVGCGVGKPTMWLARKSGAEVKGVNVSRKQVEVAEAEARSQGLEQVSFEVADAMNLPYPDDSFDRVWAVESMVHMPDRGQVMREMARVLRPGGRLVISDLAVRGTLNDEAAGVVERWCAQSRVRSVEPIENYPVLVEKAGLEIVDLTDVSEQTRPTGAAVLPAYDDLPPGLSEEDIAAAAEAKKTWAALFELTQYGYVLVTARKP